MKTVDIDYDEKDNDIVFAAPSVWTHVLKSTLAFRWDRKTQIWRTKATWPNYLRVYNTFAQDTSGQIKVQMSDGLKEWVTNLYNSSIAPCLQMREQLEPSEKPSSDLFEGMYPYQVVGAEFISTAKKALLCDDMGSGKTLTAMSAVVKNKAFPCLVVTLNSTKLNWEKEINKYYPGHKVYVVDGTLPKKRKVFKDFNENNGDFLIINWESLRAFSKMAPYGTTRIIACPECGGVNDSIDVAKCEKHNRELNMIEFQSVLADEIHRCKNPKTKQARALRAATGDAWMRVGLTGTLVANSEEEMFSPLNWLDSDSYPNKTKFIDRFFITRMNYMGFMEVCGIKPNMRAEWDQIINPIMRRMPKKVILPYLPSITYLRKDIPMIPRQKKAYIQMRDQMIADIDGGKLTVTQAMSQTTRLMQLAASYAEVELLEDIDPNTGEEVFKQKVTLTNPSNKIKAFMGDLPDYGNSQIAVFAQSKQLINLLEQTIQKENEERSKVKSSEEYLPQITYGRVTGDESTEEREQNVTRFQNGELQIMLLTLSAGSTGITLTKADVAVFLNRSYNSIENKQALDRVHRIGSEIHDNILCVDYLSEGTIDYKILDALEEKGNILESIFQDKKLIRNMISGA